jgi:hypothetical protein
MLGLRIALISLVVGAAMLSACENPGVAVGAFGSCNELHLLYKPCQPDTLLFSVRVTAWDNSAVIWEISNPTGSLLREFVLGEEPAGFTSVVAFDGSLDDELPTQAMSSTTRPRLLTWITSGRTRCTFRDEDTRPSRSMRR